MGSVLAAIATLGEVIKLGRQLFTYLKEQLKEDPRKYLIEVTEAVSELNKAKSPTERKRAASRTAALFGKLINK